MASKYKTETKSDLIAIYRLEFYRKQRDWKFRKDEVKDIATKRSPNETYNIDKPKHDFNLEDDISALNYAFVENDSDKNSPRTPLQLEAASNRHENGKDVLDMPCMESHPQECTASPKGERVWECTEDPWQNVRQVSKGYGGGEAFYPTVEQPQNYSFLQESGWPTAPCIQGSYDAGMWQSFALMDADLWLREASPYTSLETRVSDSLESVSTAEFLLGVAAVPHSSEIELTLPPESESPDVSYGGASCLSSRALVEQMSAHAALLKDLLVVQEARIQQALAAQLHERRPHRCSMSYDDHSIHDPGRVRGPYHFSTSHQNLRDSFMTGSTPQALNNHINRESGRHSQNRGSYRGLESTKLQRDHRSLEFFASKSRDNDNTRETFKEPSSECCVPVGSCEDPFIAGSFRNVAEVGKGRGRLTKERVIGIGMGGRPYRL